MAKISTHLDQKPFQVAITNNIDIPFRQWKHLGTFWASSHRAAIHKSTEGYIVSEISGRFEHRLVFELSTGLFVTVGF